MLSKVVEIDQIEVVANGNVQVRESISILEDDKVISKTYHRYVIEKNSNLEGVDPKIAAIAKAAWS